MITQKISKVFAPLYNTPKGVRYIHCWGGRSGMRSYHTTQYFAIRTLDNHSYFRGAFVRQTQETIRASLWQDLKDRITTIEAENKHINSNCYSLTDSVMKLENKHNGNKIISIGVKSSSNSNTAKTKSLAGITDVLIEEADEVSHYDFLKLDDSVRTKLSADQKIICNFNPPHKNHWLIKNYYDLEPSQYEGYYKAHAKPLTNFISIFTTYQNNIKNIHPDKVKDWINRGNPDHPHFNPEYYYIDILGLISEGKKGRIFKTLYSSLTVYEYETIHYQEFVGIDFGYNDPNAVVRMKYQESTNALFIHEVIYQTGMTIDELGAKLKASGILHQPCYCDSARPDNIRSLRLMGFNAKPCPTKDISNGIKLLLSKKLICTKISNNLINESENYCWEIDKHNKNITDIPEDSNNHLWDAIRYGATGFLNQSTGLQGGLA